MPKLIKRRVSEAQDLEESYRLADIVKQRQKTLVALKLKAGELVLDIGCGVGFLTHEMARKVGKSGKVIGLDKNPEMRVPENMTARAFAAQMLRENLKKHITQRMMLRY